MLLVFTACGGNELPAGMDDDALFVAGREVMLLLVNGKYETVHEMLREDQRELFTAEDIREVVEKELAGAGVYKQIEKHMVTGQKIDDQLYGIAVLYCDFSEEDVLIRVSFDAQLQLVGFSLKQD